MASRSSSATFCSGDIGLRFFSGAGFGAARILRRRRDRTSVRFPNSEFLFPTIEREGKVTQVVNGKKAALRGFGYTPQLARHTLASACAEARLEVRRHEESAQSPVEEHHRPHPDALDGIPQGGEAEKVARFLLDKAGAKAEAA